MVLGDVNAAALCANGYIPHVIEGWAYRNALPVARCASDLSSAELRAAHQRGLAGIDVLDDHNKFNPSGTVVGTVVGSEFDDVTSSLRVGIMLKSGEHGSAVLERIRAGIAQTPPPPGAYAGLSMAHCVHTRRITEISVCTSPVFILLSYPRHSRDRPPPSESM